MTLSILTLGVTAGEQGGQKPEPHQEMRCPSPHLLPGTETHKHIYLDILAKSLSNNSTTGGEEKGRAKTGSHAQKSLGTPSCNLNHLRSTKLQRKWADALYVHLNSCCRNKKSQNCQETNLCAQSFWVRHLLDFCYSGVKTLCTVRHPVLVSFFLTVVITVQTVMFKLNCF